VDRKRGGRADGREQGTAPTAAAATTTITHPPPSSTPPPLPLPPWQIKISCFLRDPINYLFCIFDPLVVAQALDSIHALHMEAEKQKLGMQGVTQPIHSPADITNIMCSVSLLSLTLSLPLFILVFCE
jgi:hypothetical protein